MQNDPTTYILAAALLSFCLGFFAASTYCARRIKRANIEGWKDAVRFYQSRQS